MARDPWVQRFDERADEDDRYARHTEQEGADRAAEKGDGILSQISSNVTDGGMTIEEFDRAVAAGLRGHRGPKLVPAVPPSPPTEPPGLAASWLAVMGWGLALLAALVLAAAIAVTIFMGVAWALGNGS